MMSFGVKLKEYRTLHSISQEELAKKLNTTKQVISRYENEQRSPKLSVAIEYSAKLGIPLDILVDDKKSLEPNIILSSHEKEVITAYRNQPAMQEAVDRLLGIKEEETVVLLSHKKPDGHINVKVEFGEGEGKVPLDDIAQRAESYKPKERVTYKMIKEYIEAKYGFKVHTAYIAEVKRDLGLPMYDAPNAVEELKQPRKHPTAEKVEAIKDALKHFEVI